MTLITTFYQNDLKLSFSLCKMKLIYGLSSLLFIFPTFKAFLYSQSIFWKLSNLFLIPISFLCNAMEYKNPYLVLDYLCIFLVGISYIQHFYWNHLFLYFFFLNILFMIQLVGQKILFSRPLFWNLSKKLFIIILIVFLYFLPVLFWPLFSTK
jgi:hypothetical protein